jgi:hypothetical protein
LSHTTDLNPPGSLHWFPRWRSQYPKLMSSRAQHCAAGTEVTPRACRALGGRWPWPSRRPCRRLSATGSAPAKTQDTLQSLNCPRQWTLGPFEIYSVRINLFKRGKQLISWFRGGMNTFLLGRANSLTIFSGRIASVRSVGRRLVIRPHSLAVQGSVLKFCPIGAAPEVKTQTSMKASSITFVVGN